MSLTPSPPAPLAQTPHISTTVFASAIVLVAAVSIGATSAYFVLVPHPTCTGSDCTTVVDDLGRKIQTPVNPGRIVVLAPSIMDIIYRLGLRSTVVAVGCTPSIAGGIFNEYSPQQASLWGLANASCVPDYPELNTQAVGLLTPQLVLASTITSAEAVQELTDTYGIPVVVLASSTLDGIVGDVRTVAQIFPEAGGTAVTLEVSLEKTIASASAMDENFSNENVSIPAVLLTYYFDSGGYYTYGTGSFGDSLISYAGGDNIASSVPLLYGEYNGSTALLAQPQLIVYATSNDTYLVGGETPSVWATAPYWSLFNATKVAVEVQLVTEADPTMIFFLPHLMHLFHPTLIPAP